MAEVAALVQPANRDTNATVSCFQEDRMPEQDVHLPLSGNVTQTFFPLTINVGRSSNQATEKDALSLASYGRQLGRIGDALIVLLNHIKLEDLSPDEAEAIADLKCMLRQIAKVKKRGNSKLVLSPS
jgi:hypothetical protein